MREKQVLQKPEPNFGVYDLTDSEQLTMMAEHIITTVHALLRACGHTACGEIDPNELLAAGCLLEWAGDYLAWYGLYGQKAVNERVEAERRASRSARKVA